MTDSLKVHSILPKSQANGPGTRFVIWTQGCSIKCSGCANPETHPEQGGYLASIEGLIDQISDCWLEGAIDGVTISGGEPLDQYDELSEFLRHLGNLWHLKKDEVPVILFTGYHPSDRPGMFRDLIEQQLVATIVAGPYVRGRSRGFGLCSTDNQSMIYVTDRYSYKDFLDLPEAEVIIRPDGRVVETGTFVEVK